MSLLERFFTGERLELNERTRGDMQGRFVQLSDGITHYEIEGPRDGPLVVLIHGFSVPQFIWDPTFKALVVAGFRVLRYDLFGRGFSDRPHRTNNRDFFVRQLSELLDALAIQEPANLVSLSMGAVVAVEFANRYPERVGTLSFIDPAGFDLELPCTVRLVFVPVIGEILLGMFNLLGTKALLVSMLGDFYKPTQEALNAFVPRYQTQMLYRGFKRSLLSTLRAGMLDEDLSPFRKLATSPIPIQLIWGWEDATVPYKHHKTFLQLLPQTEFHPIDQAGHIPHFERPDVVSPILVEFLQRYITIMAR
ncbi:MAG: alpha/beta hydrolase [Chloroflexi bacterium]|nr:alpha/beta hydrolase [Chloroflexota bacterium]